MGGTLPLVRLLVAAERLRWRLLLRRSAVRGALALGAMVFFCAALAMLHALAFMALVPGVAPISAAAIVLGADAVACLLLVLVAVHMGPGAGERDALAMRQAARAELVNKGRMMRLAAAAFSALRRR